MKVAIGLRILDVHGTAAEVRAVHDPIDTDAASCLSGLIGPWTRSAPNRGYGVDSDPPPSADHYRAR
jgi:hypothetical protein